MSWHRSAITEVNDWAHTGWILDIIFVNLDLTKKVLSTLTMIAPFRLSQIKKAKKEISAEKTFMFSFWPQATQSYFADLLQQQGGGGHKTHNVAKQEIVFILDIF